MQWVQATEARTLVLARPQAATFATEVSQLITTWFSTNVDIACICLIRWQVTVKACGPRDPRANSVELLRQTACPVQGYLGIGSYHVAACHHGSTAWLVIEPRSQRMAAVERAHALLDRLQFGYAIPIRQHTQ
jgi:hypothetical protein